MDFAAQHGVDVHIGGVGGVGHQNLAVGGKDVGDIVNFGARAVRDVNLLGRDGHASLGIVFFHDAVHQLFDVSGIPVEARFYALLIHGGVQRLQDGGDKRQRHIPDAQLDDGRPGYFSCVFAVISPESGRGRLLSDDTAHCQLLP